MPETPFEERVRQTLRTQADKQRFDPQTVMSTAKHARRRLERNAMFAAAFAVIVIVALLRVGGPFMDTSTPATTPTVGPSPTPSDFSTGPVSTPSNFLVTYDANELTIQGTDPTPRAIGFKIQFYRGDSGRSCAVLWSEAVDKMRAGGLGVQGVRACDASIGVGDGFGIGQVVMMFGPPGTSSATAVSHGAPQDAVVLDLPSRFIDRLSTELDRPLDLKVLVVITPVNGGSLVVRDEAGNVLSTLPLPVNNDINGYCGPPPSDGHVVGWCPGQRS